MSASAADPAPRRDAWDDPRVQAGMATMLAPVRVPVPESYRGEYRERVRALQPSPAAPSPQAQQAR